MSNEPLTQDLGKVGIDPKGQWNIASSYEAIDLVVNDGSGYLSLKNVPAGVQITNTEYWLCIAQKGAKGDTGETGNGIQSIEKTGTTGLVDTYTITYTDETTTTFTVTNGNGISSLEKTGTSGLVDTYTITFSDGTTTTFTVTNGADGEVQAVAIATPYDNTVAYKIGNLLTYLGKQYYCIADAPAGTLPTNTTYFEEKSVADIIEMIKNGSIVTGHSEVADNLTPYSEDSGTTQENPFISQGTGTDNNSVIVTTGVIARQLEKQGNTLQVEQKVKNPQFTEGTLTDWVTTNVVNGGIVNGYIKLTPNNPSSVLVISQANSVIAGHTYLYIYDVYCVHGSGSENIFPTDNNGNISSLLHPIPTTRGQITSFVYTPSATQTYVTARLYCGGSDYEIYLKSITRFDITAWNSDIITDLTSHPEHFSWYYNGSLAYDAGSLQNCNGRYLECGQGRQLWDEVATSTGYIDSDGNIVTNYGTRIASTNYIPVVPNKPVYVYIGSYAITNYGVRLAWYDKNKVKIRVFDSYTLVNTPPANAYYMRFATNNVGYNSSTYKNDITISLYYTPEEGGEGYNQHYDYVAPIRIDTGNETLLGVDGSRDTKLPSGLITRARKRYTFTGNETWEWIESWGGFRTFAITDALSVNGNTGEGCTALLPGYEEKPQYSTEANKTNMTFVLNSGYHTPNALGIINTAYGASDLDAFKAYIAGKTIEYPLATPTTEQGTPFSEYAPINDYSYMAWFDTDGNLVSIPQGCKLFYPVDYKGFTDDLVMYTNGDATALAKNEDITDTALNARGYYKMQDLLTAFGANGMVGGTLRQTLANAKSIDFDNTKCVDLGGINWSYVTSPVPYFNATISDIKYVSQLEDIANILTTIYKTVSWNTAYSADKVICLTTTNIRIKDSAFTDITAFKNSLKGQLLAYEKASA